MSSRFVLVNEYIPAGSENSSTEILGVYDEYDDAWAQLAEEAEESGSYLSKDSDYFEVSLPDSSHLESDEYMVLEFIEGERLQ